MAKTARKVVYQNSDWKPLETVMARTVGILRCRQFMYMGKVSVGEVWVFLYKHVYTRRYLNLDNQGNAYVYEDEQYYPIGLESAINYVFS